MRRDGLLEGRRAAGLLRLHGALFELGRDEVDLELGRLVRVVRLRELPVVCRVERGLRVERGHPEHARGAVREVRVGEE